MLSLLKKSPALLLGLLLITAPCSHAAPADDVQGQLSSSSSSAALPKKCREHLLKAHGTAKQQVNEGLKKELDHFRNLAEQALMLRAETISVGKRIKAQMEQKKPLSGDDLEIMNIGITEHLKLRKELMEVAESHECWLDGTEQDWIARGVSPEARLNGVMMSLSSAFLLYDNYLLSVSLFEGDAKLRRLLNEADPGYAVKSAALAKVTLSYNSINNRSRVRRAIKFYEKETKRFTQVVEANPETAYINLLIKQSPSYSMVRTWSPFYVVGRKVGFLGGVTEDTLSGLERHGISLFSMVFGNAVGLVETRKGKLYRKPPVREQLTGALQAGDVLLEKTPFRLTDKLIPGYWGHAAVWIGTEKELRELGIWDNPLVKRYHDQIHQGRGVVEALRSGVEMNPLDQFMNIDSVGVLRKQNISRDDRVRVILQSLRQVGKPYDFNFDVESKERVYCSKLVYLTYSGVEWPTKKSLGRTTFTPDDVANRALAGDFRLVLFYHNGKQVQQAPLERMASLMEQQVQASAAR
ncbi:MAG: YiiX/YebB-like N1pC/P60 family cysteine hydrolase [Trichlorobacter sp.]|uniref:YiiX/YebB-like N1pC/P60 family cysteine hydrolase n=1 Tax=Trichlorobacter sp. TaxID=2911007 RepID=UPI002564CB3E|nr:YiiX/YebB-like N1pC/P60 family cysteine hydrolase [Trichlorobacter sp.]MDK9718913.1 YiiX/YebB-like N1pC/P60 family cysteine hydrolase [Trichlorobacter sp.]